MSRSAVYASTVVSFLALASPGFAADLPRVGGATPYDWSGIYVGANTGYGVGRNPSTVGFPGFFAPEPAPESFAQSPTGWLGGIQAGYNWQFNHLVLGVEGDWQWNGQKANACAFTCSSETAVTLQQRLNSIGTLRGRIGVAEGGLLFYGTAGVATASVDTNVGLVRSLMGRSDQAGFRHTASGWVAGGGIEAALGGNWTAKVEYLYADLGSLSDSFDAPVSPPFAPMTTTTRVTSDVRDHIFRAGINYRFGGDSRAGTATEMMTKAPVLVSAHDWTGLYIGGNAGYGVGHNDASVGQTVPPIPLTTPQLFTLAPAGWLGGVQAGYNWQLSRNWVVGAEADYQRASQRDAACVLSCELIFGNGLTAQQNLTWFSTVRGRFGYSFGTALFYLTGGLAVAGVENDVQSSVSHSTTSASFNHTKTGWVAGGGLEAALGGNWSGRIEYLHMDLGSVSDSFVSPASFAPNLTTSLSSTVHSDMVRVGLNYKLTGTNR